MQEAIEKARAELEAEKQTARVAIAATSEAEASRIIQSWDAAVAAAVEGACVCDWTRGGSGCTVCAGSVRTCGGCDCCWYKCS